MASISKETIVLLGGTGKLASRISPLLASNGYHVILASRSNKSSHLTNSQNISHVKFDWSQPPTFALPLTTPVSGVLLIAPPILDMFPAMKQFIDLAVSLNVKRFVLVTGSLVEVGDGPNMKKVETYMIGLGVEFTVLRPSWFMGMQHSFTQQITV
jgi:festuclavine dehydrogenase